MAEYSQSGGLKEEEEKAELPLVTNSLIDDNNTQFASPLLEAWSLITPSRCFYSRLPLLLCPSLSGSDSNGNRRWSEREGEMDLDGSDNNGERERDRRRQTRQSLARRMVVREARFPRTFCAQALHATRGPREEITKSSELLAAAEQRRYKFPWGAQSGLFARLT